MVHWFARSWALLLLAVLPMLTLLMAWARWRRRRALARLGKPFFVERLLFVHTGWRRLQSLLTFFGILGLILAIAGPRWGAATEAPLLSGKDIVIVLDASRSMLAEQPSRLERGRRCLRDLADELERRGGHRGALVAFAAHAKLTFPLTGDYQHFRWAMEAVDPDDLPPALRPRPGEKIASGTRIGAALQLAAAAHDPRRAGRQDILLLSDGDDPAGDDEWRAGVQAARERQLPVHVVALGDPRDGHPIPQGSDLLRFEGMPVESRLNDPLLQEIARRTGGLYFPAHAGSLPLGRLLRGYLNAPPAEPSEPSPETDETALEPQARHAWFLFPALVLLASAMLIGDGPRREKEAAPAPQAERSGLFPALILIAILPALISAAPTPEAAVLELVRQGNEAFGRQDYDEALRLYGRAELDAADPGLIAFNKGAALFRLERYAEAAAHWQRSLEDGAIPPARKARAAYDLGNALCRQAGENSRRLLEQAIAAYRQCLESEPDADLKADALHNLELARWRWLKARASGADDPPDHEDPPPSAKHGETKANGRGPAGKNGEDPAHDLGPEGKGNETGAPGAQKKPAHGALVVLPDQEELTPLEPEETLTALERLADRLRREARAHRQQTAGAAAPLKDW